MSLGGIFGAKKPKTVEAPEPQRRASDLDPNLGEAISAAKKAKIAALGQAGRSSLRVDLSGGDTLAGRSGIRIA